jgi:hypothetical protein
MSGVCPGGAIERPYRNKYGEILGGSMEVTQTYMQIVLEAVCWVQIYYMYGDGMGSYVESP